MWYGGVRVESACKSQTISNMDKKDISYGDAVAEIEAILKQFENEQFDVDMLADRVKRATELIRICKGKLKKAESDVAKALGEE